MRLELHATPEEVMRAVTAVEALARAQGLPEKTVFALALAVEECGSNVVNHAYRRDSTRTFEVTFIRTDSEFVIELRDEGPAFDPTTAPRKAQATDDDLPGGLGIELVRRQMDGIHYERLGDANVLRLTKQLPTPARAADQGQSNQTTKSNPI